LPPTLRSGTIDGLAVTVSPESPPQVFADVDEAIRLLRASGLRLSTPRRLVLEALFDTDQPVTAEHIATRLRLDLTSVYRNLEVLEQQGLVRHVHLGHGPGLYALVGRHELEYLYCERCQKVTAVRADQLDPVRTSIRKRFGYQARFSHFPIVGLCERCAATPSPPPNPPDKHESRPRAPNPATVQGAFTGISAAAISGANPATPTAPPRPDTTPPHLATDHEPRPRQQRAAAQRR